MTTHREALDVSAPNSFPQGKIDTDRVDATTKADIARHMTEDDAEAADGVMRSAQRMHKR